jgi:hypothetical protein
MHQQTLSACQRFVQGAIIKQDGIWEEQGKKRKEGR